jgi:hypothetical protein
MCAMISGLHRGYYEPKSLESSIDFNRQLRGGNQYIRKSRVTPVVLKLQAEGT